jgi:hypothetical protein
VAPCAYSCLLDGNHNIGEHGFVGGEGDDIYTVLREQALVVDPASLGLAADDAPVWAVMVDMAWPEGSATLVVVADGTVSLYLSSGGGTIGGGFHEPVARAALALLELAAAQVDRLEPATEVPVPLAGGVRISALVWGDPRYRTCVENEQVLGAGNHPCSELFFAAHEVIGQLRMIDDTREGGEPESR